MRTIRTILLASAVLAVVSSPALASPTSPTAAHPGRAPVGVKATYLDARGRVMSTASVRSSGTESARFGCTPGNGADNPHYTAPDVSGHGTYIKGSCSNNTAKVYNCLYEYYTDATWRQKACSSTVTVYAGGGSGNRSNARARCSSTGQLISWRNHEDVDVIGEIDTGDTPYRQAEVYCVVN